MAGFAGKYKYSGCFFGGNISIVVVFVRKYKYSGCFFGGNISIVVVFLEEI